MTLPLTKELVFGTMNKWLAGEPVWPYKRILQEWGKGFGGRLEMLAAFNDLETSVRFPDLASHMSHGMIRHEFIDRYGFAIPCAELLDVCKEFSPVIEVGAGSGYMAKLMRNAGVDVIVTDPHDPGRYGPQEPFPAKAAVKLYSERTVFCSWPDLRDPWFADMLKAMAPGQRLIVIREECTGTPAAWKYLADHFERTDTVTIPMWMGLHDYCEVAVKRRVKTTGA